MRSRWEGESKETQGRQADRGVGERQNYSRDMEGGREDRNKKKKIQEKAMKKLRHGERANKAY